ncbi:MAG: hypothetical protein ACD_79C00957G0001, partial [uncultured bacterium]
MINNPDKYEKELIWRATRSVFETENYKHKPSGKKYKSHWTAFHHLAYIFGMFCKLFRIYERGIKSAKNLQINNMDFYFEDLPPLFDNYTILHLSDMHLDSLDDMYKIIAEKLKDLKYDLCILTGDYRKETHGSYQQIIHPMEHIVKNISAPDGILAVLGNHDSYLMVDIFRKMNIKVLINETITIRRENQEIDFTGIDDPFYYFTDRAYEALEEELNQFKIALIHTPELYEITEKNNYKLYLCGHTHGGQICLPGNIPVITHFHGPNKFARGRWKYKNMQGYTNMGCGTVVLPIRFNAPCEIALIKL